MTSEERDAYRKLAAFAKAHAQGRVVALRDEHGHPVNEASVHRLPDASDFMRGFTFEVIGAANLCREELEAYRKLAEFATAHAEGRSVTLINAHGLHLSDVDHMRVDFCDFMVGRTIEVDGKAANTSDEGTGSAPAALLVSWRLWLLRVALTLLGLAGAAFALLVGYLLITSILQLGEPSELQHPPEPWSSLP